MDASNAMNTTPMSTQPLVFSLESEALKVNPSLLPEHAKGFNVSMRDWLAQRMYKSTVYITVWSTPDANHHFNGDEFKVPGTSSVHTFLTKTLKIPWYELLKANEDAKYSIEIREEFPSLYEYLDEKVPDWRGSSPFFIAVGPRLILRLA